MRAAGIRRVLSDEEQGFLDQVRPPQIWTELNEDGEVGLLVRLYGSTSTAEWDGTVQDAEEIVDALTETQAANVSDGYWMSGGWKTRTVFDPE